MNDIIIKSAHFIGKFEGLKLTAYQDVVGVWTIGYGTTKNVTQGMTITYNQAFDLLCEDTEIFYKTVKRLIHPELQENQYIALTSFTYNLGGGALQRSTLRAKINRLELCDAAFEFLKWNKAGGKIYKGLTKRRLAESTLFLQRQ